jgi:hypothetical protein
MRFKYLAYLGALVCTLSLFSQEKMSFGEISEKDLAITSFPGDKNAHALVIMEEGNYYFDVINHRILLVKEYHAKIKILDKEGFKEGTVSIPYYRGTGSSESVENIRAITHNGSRKISVMPNAIFDKNINGKWHEKTFTFSDIEQVVEGLVRCAHRRAIALAYLLNLVFVTTQRERRLVAGVEDGAATTTNMVGPSNPPLAVFQKRFAAGPT